MRATTPQRASHGPRSRGLTHASSSSVHWARGLSLSGRADESGTTPRRFDGAPVSLSRGGHGHARGRIGARCAWRRRDRNTRLSARQVRKVDWSLDLARCGVGLECDSRARLTPPSPRFPASLPHTRISPLTLLRATDPTSNRGRTRACRRRRRRRDAAAAAAAHAAAADDDDNDDDDDAAVVAAGPECSS